MNEELEMFEAIEMHVERMLSQVSESEKRNNPSLPKYEERMQRFLDRLRTIITEKESESSEESGAENANA
jgi:hypothetical protein